MFLSTRTDPDQPTSSAASQPTAEQVLDSLPVGVLVLDEQGLIRRVNPQAARWCGAAPDALLGLPLPEAGLPADLYATLLGLLEPGPHPAREVYLPTQQQWVAFSSAPQAAGWVLYGQDITAHHQPQAPLPPLAYAPTEGYCVLEVLFDQAGQQALDFRYLELNGVFAQQSGMLPDIQGRTARELLPDLEPFWFETYGRVARTGQAVRVEHYVAAVSRWFDVHAFRVGQPEARQVAVLFNDITARKRHENNLAFMAGLMSDFAPLNTVEEVMELAGRRITEYLQLSHCFFVAVDPEAETCTVLHHARPAGLPAMTGTYPLNDFHTPAENRQLAAGQPMIVSDVDDGHRSAAQVEAYRALGIRALVNTPHVAQGRWVFDLGVCRPQPGAWAPDEIGLLQDVAGRVWLRLERAGAEAALRNSEATLAAVFDALPVGIGLTAADGHLTLANHQMRRYLPTGIMPSRDATQLPRWHAVGPDGHPLPPTEFPGARAQRGERVVPGLEMLHTPAEGPPVWTQVFAVPLRYPHDQVAGHVTVILDIDAQKRTEQALRHSEEQFRLFVTTSADTFYRMSPDWQQMQPLGGKNFFAPNDEARTPWVERYIPAEDQAATWAAIHAAIAAKQPFALEHRVWRADGGVAWVASRAIPVLDAQGNLVEWFGAATDITARKRTEANLALLADISQELAQLTSLDETMNQLGAKIGAHFGLSRCLFVEIDETHEVCWVAYGWSREGAVDIPGRHPIVDFISPEFQRASRAGETVVIDDVFADPRTEGEQYAAFQIQAMVTVPLQRDGEWCFLLGFYDTKPRHWQADELALLRELTARIWTRLERARAEEALRQSEEQFRTVVNLVPDLLWRSTAEGETHWYNQRWYEYTGQSVAVADGWADAIHPDDRAGSAQHYRAAMLTGQPLQQEHRIRSAAGEYRWFQVQALPVRDEQGRVTECFGAATDIHTRKLAEAALAADKAWLEHEVAERTHEVEASRDLLQSVFDTNLIAMSVLQAVRDDTGTIQDFRLVLVSQELERETGRTDLEGKLYSQEFPGIREVGIFDLIVRAVETGEPQGMEYFYPHEGFDKWFACQFVKLGDGVVATNLDITERKTTEQELLKNLRLLEQAEAVAGLGSWDYDIATGTMRWSDGMYQLFGLPAGSPATPNRYREAVLEEDRPRAEQLLHQLAAGQGFEETLRLRVHGQVKIVRMKAVALSNEQGQPGRVLGVDVDISQLHHLEQDNLRLRLRQQRALFEAVQEAQEAERKRIAEGLHNGIGQLLYATKLRLDQLHVPVLHTHPTLVVARQEADRLLADAIRQTRVLSHELVPIMLEEFGLTAALQDIGAKMSSPQLLLHCQVQLDEEAGPIPPPLQVALYRMAQELAQNVIKHAQGATEASLEVETTPGWVLLRVEDNGPGFAAKPASATGLGLRSIRDRVELLGGAMETGTSGGAYVRIRLPLAPLS
ncbi:PAS domain-containing protein [Hymenobacter metallicola]|uniref:histidine kinase n=1 Tax=Hymenobacter metallicola TaxID=2563114 RepID=A0A4Z0QK81_9BACT|nr:PAS domain-containing protein [Hymenobacter metallicola]TGE29431.1 PAS domain S-box protein [Hymenobacter metallicola]